MYSAGARLSLDKSRLGIPGRSPIPCSAQPGSPSVPKAHNPSAARMIETEIMRIVSA
jgi:hypothetical protein